MVATTTTHRQTTYKCYPIVPGGKSARDKNHNNVGHLEPLPSTIFEVYQRNRYTYEITSSVSDGDHVTADSLGRKRRDNAQMTIVSSFVLAGEFFNVLKTCINQFIH